MTEYAGGDPGSARPQGHARPPAVPGDPGPALTPREFEELVLELADPLMGAALRLCRNRADAEDLVQDTLHRAWRSLGSFRRGTRFRAWIFRILRNAFLNRREHEARAPHATDPADLRPEARPERLPDVRALGEVEGLLDRHFDERVKAAVEALPHAQLEPFVLFALGGLGYQEIADALGVPIGTVMSRLHRARAKLRAELGGHVRATGFPAGGA